MHFKRAICIPSWFASKPVGKVTVGIIKVLPDGVIHVKVEEPFFVDSRWDNAFWGCSVCCLQLLQLLPEIVIPLNLFYDSFKNETSYKMPG